MNGSRDEGLVACLFSHTPFSLWGLHLVERVLRVLQRDFHRIHCNDLKDLRAGWLERGERPTLLTSDAPKEELIRLLAVSSIKTLVFLDDPARLIELAIYAHGVAPLDALRGCTYFFIAFWRATSIPSALVVRSDDSDVGVESVVRQVVARILGDERAHAMEAVVAAVLPETPAPPRTRPGDPRLLHAALQPGNTMQTVPSAEELAVIEAVVEDYRALYRQDGMSFVTWPRELFFTANIDQRRPEEIHLAGDARDLIRGPCCCLPAGRWRIAVEFEVSNHVAGDSVQADVVMLGAGTLARGQFVLPSRGIFRYSLDFTINEAKAPIETRLRLLKGAIRGVLCLRSVTASRLSRPADDRLEIAEGPKAIAHDRTPSRGVALAG